MSNPNPYSNLNQTLIITAAPILTRKAKITLRVGHDVFKNIAKPDHTPTRHNTLLSFCISCLISDSWSDVGAGR